MKTDRELIAEFMEARPTNVPGLFEPDETDWWKFDPYVPSVSWEAKPQTLDMMHLVEQKFTLEHWELYLNSFASPIERRNKVFSWDRGSALLNANAEMKVRKAGSVLRSMETREVKEA